MFDKSSLLLSLFLVVVLWDLVFSWKVGVVNASWVEDLEPLVGVVVQWVLGLAPVHIRTPNGQSDQSKGCDTTKCPHNEKQWLDGLVMFQ